MELYNSLIIGRSIQVVESSDPSLARRGGLVVDETRNTIVFVDERSNRLIRIPKSVVKLNISAKSDSLESRTFLINGIELLARPEERIKG